MRKLLLLVCLAAPAWATWPNGYSGRHLFTFNVHPSAALTNFPNLISGTYAEFADTGHGGYVTHTVTLNGQTVPADLIFTASDGATLLNWEIESWNNTTGAIVAWVQATRSSSADTLVYGYAGNSSVSTYQGTASSTWDTYYKGVWHFPNGTTLSALDSTGVNNGTINGAAAGSGPSSLDGAATIATSTGGSNNISLAANSTLNITGDFTMSAWIKIASNTAHNGVYDWFQNGGSYAGLGVSVGYPTAHKIGFYTNNDSCSGTSGDWRPGTITVDDGNWHYIVEQITGSNGNKTMTVDGNSDYSGCGAVAGSYGGPGYIGNLWGATTAGFTGTIAELRVSNAGPSVRSAAWVAHEVTQQTPGAAVWYTVGAWSTGTDYNCTGPSPASGYEGAASNNITCTKASGTWSTGNTVTIADNASTAGYISPSVGSAGTSPLTVTPGNGASSFTYTYTPATVAAITLSYSNNYSATDSNPDNYTSNTPALSFGSCPSSGNLNTASLTCTVNLGGPAFNGSYSVTISDADSNGNGNLGTIAMTGGGSGTSTLTVTPSSGTWFSFTYTPKHIGTINLKITNGQGWTNPGAQAYAVSSSDVCTFTAKANGNWASASTWTASGCTGSGHSYPVSGDSPISFSGYHVTIPNGTTAYAGSCPSSSTTWDLTVAPSGGASGWLEVAGTLWLCGNIKLNAPANATPTSFGIFQMDTGSSLTWDMNGGSTAYRLVPSTTGGWNNLIIGTLGDTCTFPVWPTETCPTNITPVNIGTANPILVDTNSTTDSMTYQVYGLLMKNCGSASVGCLNYATDGTTGRNSYANAGLIDVEGSIFDTTGTVQMESGNVWNTAVTWPVFKENRFVRDLLGFLSIGQAFSSTVKNTCLFADNYFSGVFGNGNSDMPGCSFTGNVFQSSAIILEVTGTRLIGAFQGNVFLTQASDLDVATTGSPVQGNYFTATPSGGSVHQTDFTLANEKYIGNVHEGLGSGQAEGHCTIDQNNSGYTHILLDNISTLTPNGYTACMMASPGFGSMGGSACAVSYIDHNGVFGNGVYAWLAFNGHTGGPPPYFCTGQVLRSLRSNIGSSATSGSQNLAIGGIALSTAMLADMPNNNVYLPGENWNVWNNANTSPSDYTTGVNTGCSPSSSQGTPYDQCTASGTPGTNDITADPKLLGGDTYTSNTRGILTWASQLHGQAASLTGAENALISCPNLSWCSTQLVSWVQRNYQPTNMAFKGKAFDGRIVGFAGNLGSGYSGTCGVTITPQDSDDLGYGAAASCTFVSGTPSIQITNPGMHYRMATPAAVAVTCGGCTPSVAASLTPVISPHDPGPVQMVAFGRVE
jgi:hypothetical protein